MSSDRLPNPQFKVAPPPGYPPEEGRFVRGNDLSPVAVCVILRYREDEIPESIERLVRAGAESGAALSGTLQTENIGLEKMLCNLAANPNIRWLVLCGPESPGHLTGQAVLALAANGVDADSRIIGAEGPTPYLYNLRPEVIQRFREQIAVVDLLNEGDAAIIRDSVWSCYQEEPTTFRGYSLFDPGAFREEPICSTITWRIAQPWYAPRNAQEREAHGRLQDFMAEVRRRASRCDSPDDPQ